MVKFLKIQQYFKANLQKKFAIFLIIFIFISLFFIILNYMNTFSNIQFILADNLYGEKKPLDNIIILSIDDESINKIGRWPWDREVFAQILKKINNEKVIGIDVTFFESSNEKSDLKLSEEMKKHKVVLASEFISFKEENRNVFGDKILKPIPILEENAKTGYVNIITDNDGITRRVNLNLSIDEKYFAHVIFEEAFELKREVNNEFIINFINKPYSFSYIKANDVLSGNFDSNIFKDKIILIGATSPDLHDNFFVPTSYGTPMPGVEVQATIIQNLLNNEDLRNQTKFLTALLIILSGFIVLLLVYYTKPQINIPILLFLIIIYEITVIKIFEQNIIMNVLYVPLTIIFSYLVLNGASYLIEYNLKQQIKNAFGKYLSPIVVEQLIKDKDKLKLGGEEREVTIFFSDIRGFTTISEKLSPTELVKMLNYYLTINTDIILENGGTVDKYIGDAIMAFWGAPLEDKDYTKKAAETCIKLKYALDPIKKKFKLKYGVDFDIGMGLNTGKVIVGNIGSTKRFDYTVIGDEINLGSRLEGLTKQYGVNLIISDSTKGNLNEEFITRELDLVAVKGKKKPVAIFELIDLKKNINKEEYKKLKFFIETYEKGLSLYRTSRFKQAINFFKKAYMLKKDKSSDVMIQRCKEFILNPQKDFNGVYVAKSK